MSAALSKILAILDLERTGENSFRGTDSFAIRNRVFGGQIVAQALVAAARTVEGAAPHSLHGYFLVGGDPSTPIDYEVERMRDGRSFSTRRCVAIQHGQPIFTLTCPFHAPEQGFDHALEMPVVPDPETLISPEGFAPAPSPLVPAGPQRSFHAEPAIQARPGPAAPPHTPTHRPRVRLRKNQKWPKRHRWRPGKTPAAKEVGFEEPGEPAEPEPPSMPDAVYVLAQVLLQNEAEARRRKAERYKNMLGL